MGGTGELTIQLEAFGTVGIGNRFQQKATGFGHAQGRQAVEHGKGLFAHDAIQHLLGALFFTLAGSRGQIMRQGFPQ